MNDSAAALGIRAFYKREVEKKKDVLKDGGNGDGLGITSLSQLSCLSHWHMWRRKKQNKI